MNENDPRRDADLLKLMRENQQEAEEPVAVRPARRPPESARCELCGSERLSHVPTFSTGSGIAFRVFAEDVICHQCGHIGPYAIE